MGNLKTTTMMMMMIKALSFQKQEGKRPNKEAKLSLLSSVLPHAIVRAGLSFSHFHAESALKRVKAC